MELAKQLGSIITRKACTGTLVLFALGCAQPMQGGQSSGGTGEFPDAPQSSLVDFTQAELIVDGVAGEGRSFWSDDDGIVMTDTPFTIERVQRGTANGTLTVRTRGGETPEYVSTSSHAARFRAGEHARVFLTHADDGSWHVIGGFLGKQLPLHVEPPQANKDPSVASVSAAASCVGSSYCYLDGRARYPWNMFPIPYWVNPAISANHVVGTQDQIVAAVKAAFQTWEDDVPSGVEWAYQGTTSAATTPAGSWNVRFAPLDPGDAAETDVTHVNSQTNSLIASTLTLNSNICWRTDGATATCPASNDIYYDIQTSVTHESGHILGLSHIPDTFTFTTQPVPDKTNVMYYRYTGVPVRALGAADKTAISTAYPAGWSSWENVGAFNGVNGFDTYSSYYGHIALISNEYVSSAQPQWLFYSTHVPGSAWHTRDTMQMAGTSKPSIFDLVFLGEITLTAQRAADASTTLLTEINFASPTQSSYGGLTNYPPAVTYTGGTTNLWVTGLDNALWYRSTTSNWARVNTQVLASGPDAIVLDQNNVLIVARGPNFELLTMWFTSVGLSGWTNRGGPILGTPSGTARGTGIDIVARDSSGKLLYMTYRPPNNWSTLHLLDLNDTTVLTEDPSAVSWQPKRLDVFSGTGSGLGAQIVHKRLTQ